MRENKGYIAITSAIIIMALILTVAGVVSFSSYFNRSGSLGASLKERSRAFAEACADHALLKLALDDSYGGNEAVFVTPSESCEILQIETAGSQKTIKTTAVVEKTTTNIKVITSVQPLTVISWEEVPEH
ncbi:hypothetical protein A3A20_01655 [Candidatus Wolfebacteria bacterium RIFCSPLOWO2_01_FULL_45_19]|uniref:Type 4 fimbrial biogenesis protein PilX N-terminal domain-containing protein n=1 Tax=Candidatus Wolfebacteria bacterium RIFCSPLOWO2_01_FULL_45_19 TaxID=1802557 RepID=A0A1F8DUX1_9BACT|nr:MAG: hypothetical protein UX23_C0002G0036 [Parcubacteria group bacterium GW2011_GWB1_45_9]OGM91625.1 MAG: hypothetical protein A3A20_01655 [Candidatus Wolfebacteria bacterium RIFCSPLOWO2_01_FULL_45_19]